MGPPGSGKTTTGKHIALITDDTVFISVGEYLRKKLSLNPPFDGINRDSIFEKIIEEFRYTNKKHLIIDCNPFPEEMWSAVSRHLHKFIKRNFFVITADIETLQKRLTKRKRKDSPSFSDDNRLKYYFENVEPAITALSSQEKMEFLQNATCADYKNCINIITANI